MVDKYRPCTLVLSFSPRTKFKQEHHMQVPMFSCGVLDGGYKGQLEKKGHNSEKYASEKYAF